MKQNQDRLCMLLAGVCGCFLLAAILADTFAPRWIFPMLDGVTMTALSLIALVLDGYLSPRTQRNYRLLPFYAAMVFGLMPYASGAADWNTAIWLAPVGSILFTLATWLFDSITDRISSGSASKAAPLISAVCIFLGAQCLAGIV